MKNILDIRNRGEFREWLTDNCTKEKECWIAVKRRKTPTEDALWYLDMHLSDGRSYSIAVFIENSGYDMQQTEEIVAKISEIVYNNLSRQRLR
ncbi:MAG: hypothetical protein K2N48_01250 [Muribaculaceae bacterium]|nr:hypothetical protein [Muribaculaceae bacterium]